MVLYIAAVRVRRGDWVPSRNVRVSGAILGLALGIGSLGLVLPAMALSSLVGISLAAVGAGLLVRAQSRPSLPGALRRAGWLALATGIVILLDIIVVQAASSV